MSARGFPHWPPQSLEEAHAWRQTRVERKFDLDAQLGNTNVSDQSGARVDSHAYHDWRNRARYAAIATMKEISQLNTWIKEQNREMQAQIVAKDRSVNPRDVTSLIRASLGVIKKMRADGVEFEPEDIAVQDALHEWLMQLRPVSGPCVECGDTAEGAKHG